MAIFSGFSQLKNGGSFHSYVSLPEGNPSKAWFRKVGKPRGKVTGSGVQADTLAQMAIDQNHTGHFDMCRALGLINGWVFQGF